MVSEQAIDAVFEVEKKIDPAFEVDKKKKDFVFESHRLPNVKIFTRV